MYFDPLFLIISIPALLFGLWAQWKVQSAFRKYSKAGLSTNLNGAQIARRVLDFNGLHAVRVEMTQGFLSDHYDPSGKVLRLSPDVYNSSSLAAAGVAAHEAGHAIQDKDSYLALRLRTAMVPTVQIGSWLGPIIFLAGLLMASLIGPGLAWIGLVLFGLTTAFTWLTLPVEFNASARAKQALVAQGIVGQNEMSGVNRVLDAAALTYVAAAVQAVSTLIYYGLLMTGLSGDE